jgi:phosphatidylinositol glycan class W
MSRIGAPSLRHGPIVDFVSMVLPILLGVTVFSNRPYTYNGILLIAASLARLYSRGGLIDSRSRIGPNGAAGEQHLKSKGEWLDESDSDEEPAEPLESAFLDVPPSQPISATSSGVSLSSSPNPSPSMLVPETPIDYKARKRRHSPTPSTHNHTAIDILPTPELAGPGRLSNQQSSYPSPMAARLKQVQAKLPFLSVYRAHMMIMTLHCILAVDFKVFPRVQGKCEDFGTSLVSLCGPMALMVDGRGCGVFRILPRRGVHQELCLRRLLERITSTR